MYSKQEVAAINQAFWLTFGRYMAPVPSASGDRVNWINYKTGVKGIRFTMSVNNKEALAQIFISGDEENRLKIRKIFDLLKEELNGFEIPEAVDSMGSYLESRLVKVSIFNKEDWPEIISFLKSRIIKFDQFWTENKLIFDSSI